MYAPHVAGNLFNKIEEGNVSAGVINKSNAFPLEHIYNVEHTPIVFDPGELLFATKKGSNTELLYAIDRHLLMMKKDYGKYAPFG